MGGGWGATGTDPRLHRLLGGEPVAWLLRRARDRLEAGRPPTGTVTLPSATPDQRQAVERLTGRAARSGASLSVSLAEVDRILRDGEPAATPWDPELATAMRRHGIRIEEEFALDALLQDLSR